MTGKMLLEVALLVDFAFISVDVVTTERADIVRCGTP